MEHPKPHPPKPVPSKKVEEPVKETKPSPKKPYVLRPHLTDRPLRNNEVLVNFQKSMNEPNPRRPRRHK